MTKAIEAAARAIFAQRYKSSEYVFGEYLPGTDFCRSEAQAAITAYLAAMKAEGFVMVPVEPTEAMVDAFSGETGFGYDGSIHDGYRAMIAASTQHDDGGE